MKEKRNDLVKSNSIVYSNNNILHSISICNINDMGNSYSNKYNKGGIKNDNSKSR